jgi:MraZ protein
VEKGGDKWIKVANSLARVGFSPAAIFFLPEAHGRALISGRDGRFRMTSISHSHFRGRFEIKIDPKGRLSLPSAYRPQAPQAPSLIITNSRYLGKSCLHVYTLAEWEKLERKINKLSSLKPEVQAFNRFYLSGGQLVEVDSQNRILVPQSLRKFAVLETQAVLVGLGSKFEIWAQDTWSQIYSNLTESFEATMDAVARLDSEGDGE